MSLNFKNELDFINSFTRNTDDKKVICGIGDDCAVIEYKPGLHLIITTDMIVENVHFKLKWHTPYQIGKKLMEINVSDIVSMGGIPKYAFLSMAIKKNTESIFFNEFFKGLYNSAEKHGVLLLGGDTTGGNSLVFNLTLTGEVNKKYLRLRSMASNGDIICVTGTLGGSTAGLNLLQNNLKGYLDDYLLPCSRTKEECLLIAEYANAMIDISDGLGSEIKHICRSSSKGASIDFNKIPVSNNTIKSASSLNKDPFEFALYGGEDYEILFTINKDNINQLKKVFYDFTEIGIILSESEGISIIKNNKKMSIKNGFDHFKNSIL
jgi:thiamine-monophosphate kinase